MVTDHSLRTLETALTWICESFAVAASDVLILPLTWREAFSHDVHVWQFDGYICFYWFARRIV